MVDRYDTNGERSQHFISSLDAIDKWRLLDHETNVGGKNHEMEVEPIVKGKEEVEANDIFVGQIFVDEEEAYHTYNLYDYQLGLEYEYARSRTDQKVIWRRLVYNKEG